MITVDDMTIYLDGTSYTDEQIQEAIDAETAAQAAACRISDPMPPDLAEALKRRVMRNLAMRKLPLAVESGDAGIAYVPGRDPEIRRLEGPHRRWVIG